MCPTQMRLKHKRNINIITPPIQTVSIMGILDSSQMDNLSVKLRDGDSWTIIKVPVTPVTCFVSGNIVMNVDKAITTMPHNPSVEIV